MTRENIIKLEEKTKGLKEVLGGLKNRLSSGTPKPKILSPVDSKSLSPRKGNKQRKQTIASDTSFKGSKSGEQPIKKTPKGKVVRQKKITPYKERGHTVFRRGGKRGAAAADPHATRLRKDGVGYGNLFTANTLAFGTVIDDTFVGLPANDPEKQETYIGHDVKEKVDMNKISKTRIGDDIHYYVNGVEDRGIVSKMSSTYVTVFKEDGKFYDIHINDTFFVKDILINKTWNNMSLEERTDVLLKVKAYSPRFLYKHWEDLPRELKDVMKEVVKPTIKAEHNDGVYGNVAGMSNIGVSTKIPVDTDEDYKGHKIDDKEYFKYEDKKPEVSKAKDYETTRTSDDEIGSQHRSHNTPTKPDKKVGGWEESMGNTLIGESGVIGHIGSKDPFKVLTDLINSKSKKPEVSKAVYDEFGIDEDGYNKDGYDKVGRDKDGYGRDGYNKKGFDKSGHDYYGRDKDGLDKNKLPKPTTKGESPNTPTKGNSKFGDYHLVYDKNGLDEDGWDTQGYNKYGDRKPVFDKHGYNQYGYDISGYDKGGLDKNKLPKPTTKGDAGMSTTADTSNMNATYGGKKDEQDKKKIGEFIYTESSKYKLKGIPEQFVSYGVKYKTTNNAIERAKKKLRNQGDPHEMDDINYGLEKKAGEEKGITRDSEHETDEDRKDITQRVKY